MTREEAIKTLDDMWKMLTSAYDDIADSHVAAYTMAVDALKAQGTCEDAVSRQTLQKELALYPIDDVTTEDEAGYNRAINDVQKMVLHLPSVQPELCEYYALCRHGRDESKLRARLKFCEYCNEDSDGYVKPIEKNNHAFVRFGMNGWELDLKANGWHGSAKIRYCPMCGRDLYVK